MGLKEVSRQGNQLDEAVELANSFSHYGDFRDEVISRAMLSKRTVTQLHQEKSIAKNGEAEKLWIEQKFSEINLCSLPDVSIPRRVYVYLSPNILDIREYPFRSIIDTRGIYEGKDRQDLSSYIRDNYATICIFTEKFSDVPTNVIGLICKYLTSESKDIDTKLSLLAMPRQGEPAKVVGQSGKVSSREEGIVIRKSQILDSFEGRNINFLPSNILFYDALQFYDDEERVLKPRYSLNHVEQDKSRILNELSKLIERRREVLQNEAESLSLLADKIKNGELSPEDERRIEALKKTIEQWRETNFSFGFKSSYLHNLKSYHIMVFRAINNRCGIYEYKGIDIYFDAKSLTEELLRRRFGEPKSEIVGAIKNTEEGSSDESGLKPVLEVLRYQIDEYYENLIIQLGKEIYNLLTTKQFAPIDDSNPFWAEVQGRWGKGKGYRDDVLEMYRNQLGVVDEFLKEKAQELWHQEFMSRILEFFVEG